MGGTLGALLCEIVTQIFLQDYQRVSPMVATLSYGPTRGHIKGYGLPMVRPEEETNRDPMVSLQVVDFKWNKVESLFYRSDT